MKPTVNKLVDVILQRLQEHPEARHSENGMRTWLVEQGYTKPEIEAAMNMVRPQFSLRPKTPRRVGRLRQLGAHERFRLTPEARNALARLELYEMLDPAELEFVLERFDQFDGEIGLPELEFLLSWVLSGRDYEYQQTVLGVLEGQPDALH